jgi:hypothetical protein
LHYGTAAQRGPTPALFTLITPSGFDPIMFVMATTMAFYPNFVPLLFKMEPTGFFRIKMCRKTENIHRLYYLLSDKYTKLWVITDIQKINLSHYTSLSRR